MKFLPIVIGTMLLMLLLVAIPGAEPQSQDDPSGFIPYTIRVFVYDEDGVAIEGAKVTLEHLDSETKDTEYTDSDGETYFGLESIYPTYDEGDQVRITGSKGTLSGAVVHTVVDINSIGVAEETVTMTTTPISDGGFNTDVPFTTWAMLLGISVVLIAILVLFLRMGK